MNTLWNFIALYLPSIRVYTDLQNNYLHEEESDDESYDLPTTTYNSMTLPNPSKLGQCHDRTISRPTDADQTRIKQLETFNNRLQEQVLTLQRQLEHIHADFSS